MKHSSFFKDKLAVITGSSMGIGKELARQILINGGKVVLTGRDAARLEATKKEFEMYSGSILIHKGDASNFELNQILINKTIERFDKLDILITNAGLSGYGEVEMLKPGVARNIIDTNIYGTLFPIMTAIPELKKTKGSVLLISSIAGFYGLPQYSTYSLSKMALKALAQSLRIELKSSGVFVGIAYLGFTKNEDDKKTFNPDGELENVPQRPDRLTETREKTALKILNQIINRKHSVTHSILGKLVAITSLFFPTIWFKVLSKKYYKK